MRSLETILQDVRLCRSATGNENLPSLFTELELALLEVDSWPNDLFQRLLELQRDCGYRRLENSWTLLYFLNNSWEQLTPQQREELREALIEGFDKYQNWMGAFVTSELLGERYADEDALEALSDLGKSACLPARAAVPHGIEVLAKITSDESLRSFALDRLRELLKNDSEQVRKEALLSLKKLGSG